jgi:branched-chain amino acid transport system substrate-binding protein
MKKISLFWGLLGCLLLSAMVSVFTGCKKDSGSLKIGLVMPYSGSVAVYGSRSRDGALLAIDEINAAGGLNGQKLVAIAEDDEGNAEKSVNAFTKLTSRDGVKYIIGSSTSGATMAMTNLAQQAGVVLITPSGTNVDVTTAGDYIFRTCFIDPFQGVVAGNFAYDTLGSRNAAVFYDNGADYNVGLADNFKQQFAARGGKIAADESYSTGDVDFNAQITRIKAVNPDLVYLPNYYSDVSLIAKQLRAQGVNAALLGGDGWDGLVDNAGDEVLGGYFTAGFSPDSTAPNVVAFVKAHKAKFPNAECTQFSSLGYDSMMLLADAMKAAKSNDPKVVKDALAKLSGSYTSGNIRFDANRNPIKGAAILEIVKSGGKLTTAYKTTVNP